MPGCLSAILHAGSATGCAPVTPSLRGRVAAAAVGRSCAAGAWGEGACAKCRAALCLRARMLPANLCADQPAFRFDWQHYLVEATFGFVTVISAHVALLESAGVQNQQNKCKQQPSSSHGSTYSVAQGANAGPWPRPYDQLQLFLRGVHGCSVALAPSGRQPGQHTFVRHQIDTVPVTSAIHELFAAFRAFKEMFPVAGPAFKRLIGSYYWAAGRHSKAMSKWAEAVDIGTKLGTRFEVALAHYEIGRHIDYRLSDARRSAHLAAALAQFDDMGAQRLRRFAMEELELKDVMPVKVNPMAMAERHH